MLDELNDINLGKVSNNDFKESKSITIIRRIMETNGNIKVRTNEADKIPNLDGKIMILDKNSMERITIEVQIKTLPSSYSETNPYKYSCDTKVFNVVKYNVTFNPVVLLLVDETSEKIYWKYISKDYANSLNIKNQNNKTITFTDKDLFIESNFLNCMINAFKKIGIIIENGENPYLLVNNNNNIEELQYEVDRINEMFDKDLKQVKQLLFPNVWKFGIAYNKYDNGFTAIGIYSILKGKNDILIRNFDIKSDNYMQMSITSDKSNKSIKDSINGWIENVLNIYFNVCKIHPKFLPTIVLNEIAFNFLDRLARDVKELQEKNTDNYKNESETVENVIKYYNALKLYHWRLVNELPNSPLTKALLNIYKPYGNRFLLFNPLLQPNKEEYELLLDSIKNPTLLPKNVEFVSSDIDIELLESTLEELKRRKINKINRVWNTKKWELYKEEQKSNENLKCCAHGYIITDLYDNLDYLYSNIIDLYNETYKNKFDINDKFRLTGEFLITYNKKTPYHYDLFYHNSNILSIKLEHIEKEVAQKKYGNFSYYEVSSSGSIDSAFGIKLPLYNHIRLLINLGISLSYGLKFKYNSEYNDTYLIKQLPIISDYINFTEKK